MPAIVCKFRNTIAICLVAFPISTNAESALFFTSSPSSWVGKGETLLATTSNGYTISGSRYYVQGAYTNAVTFSIQESTSFGDWWYLYLVGPELTLLTVGEYPDAARWPFQDYDQAGLSFSGNGAGNNRLSGYFTVLEAVYDSAGKVEQFAVDFVQYDEEDTDAWVRGSLRFNSSVPIPEANSIFLSAIGALVVVGWMMIKHNSNAHR